jgi:hypothetical protein
MKYIILFTLIVILVEAKEPDATMKLSHKACMKAKYANSFGGTLHSRGILQGRLHDSSVASLPQTTEEALKILQERYPELHIKKISFIIRNCKGYYLSKTGNLRHYFDPITLKYLKTSGE